MKISIITVCYNSANTIEDTLKSILNQTYTNYEYIIVDGDSKDNTLEIIKKYKSKFMNKIKIISETDKGIFDAMNKGIKNSTGDIIGILNSDDILAHENVFSKIVKTFEKTNCEGIYSNLYILDKDLNKVLRKFKAKKGNYKLGWYPPHPTLYVLKKIYNNYGYYNLDYKIASDYDFMIRIMKNKIKLSYIKDCLVYMRGGGISTDGLNGYKKSFNESIKVLKNNGIKFPYLVNFIRTFNIFNQVFAGKFSKRKLSAMTDNMKKQNVNTDRNYHFH